MDLMQIQSLADLGEKLTTEDVNKLKAFLNFPAGLSQTVLDAHDFLSALQDWGEHDSYKFNLCLTAIRPDLAPIARNVHWLSTSDPTSRSDATQREVNPMKSLVKLLKTEIERQQWVTIGMQFPDLKTLTEIDHKIELLIKVGVIEKNLEKLSNLMMSVNRNDLADKLKNYASIFAEMPDQLFTNCFLKELMSQKKDLEQWIQSLTKYIITQNRKVKQMIDDEESVSVESVYVPLTILKEKPRAVELEDETTYNEIAYLRKIASKRSDIEPVDFQLELAEYDINSPQIWCLIGNPGSGKTFLCHRTALRFGMGELSQFTYVICIPCREQEWHAMERARKEAEIPIDGDFIQTWLCLSMPVGPNWTSDLAEHMVESDGEGMLIIIDSMDEYTREVPFKKPSYFSSLPGKLSASPPSC